MGIIIRQSLKTSLVSYVGIAIGACSVLWLYPKFLTPDEIGLMRVVQDIAIVFVGLTHIGTLSLTDKFFPYYKDHAQHHHGFFPLTLFVAFLFFVLYCFGTFFFKENILGFYQEKSPQIRLYFHYTIPLVLFMLYQFVLESYTRAHLRIVFSGIVREIFLRVMIIILILFYYFKFIDFLDFMGGLVLSYAISVICLVFYIKELKILYLKVSIKLVNKDFIKKILYFYLYVIIVGLHRMIISRIDILMIPALLSTNATGIYSIALFFGTAIDTPCRVVNQISTPIIAQAWATNDHKKIQEIYQKSSINQFIIAGLLFLGIWCNIDNIFHIMPNGKIYESGKYVVLLIGLTRLVEMAAGASDVIIIHSKHYVFNTLLIIALAILLFITNLFLIPIYGITGAALATFLSMTFYVLVKFIFLWAMFRMQPFTSNSLWTLAAICLTLLIESSIPYMNQTILDIIVRSMVIATSFLTSIYLLNISEDINNIIHNSFRIGKILMCKHGSSY